MAFARWEGDFVAGLAYLWTKDRAITVRSGATARGYEKYATYFLQHQVLLRLKDSGIKQVNLGGVPHDAMEPQHPQHGLYCFKKGFGGKPSIRTSVDLDVMESLKRIM